MAKHTDFKIIKMFRNDRGYIQAIVSKGDENTENSVFYIDGAWQLFTRSGMFEMVNHRILIDLEAKRKTIDLVQGALF